MSRFKVSQSEITIGLQVGETIVIPHLQFEVIDSTNDECKRLYQENNDLVAVVTSDIQLNGRGRGRNVWYSGSPGGLYYSMVVSSPLLSVNRLYRLSYDVGAAAASVISNLTSVHVILSPPNDLMIEGKKVGGILIESSIKRSVNYVIVGIGLNLNQSEFPADIHRLAVSLHQTTGKTIKKHPLIVAITESLYTMLLGTTH